MIIKYVNRSNEPALANLNEAQRLRARPGAGDWEVAIFYTDTRVLDPSNAFQPLPR